MHTPLCVFLKKKNRFEDTIFPPCIESFKQFMIAAGYAEQSIRLYCADLVKIYKSTHSNCFSTMDALDIQRLFAFFKQEKNISASSVNRCISSVKCYYKWFCSIQPLSENPASSLLLHRARSKITTPFTEHEIKAFFHAIQNSDDKYRLRDEALFATYAYTGIRRSEAIRLRKNDFCTLTNRLYIERPKAGDGYWVPVIPRLKMLLQQLSVFEIDGNLPLFFGNEPRCLNPRYVQQRFDKWKKKSLIRKELKIHSFRVGFATRLYTKTNDIFLVQQALNHADIRTTLKYVHPDNRYLHNRIFISLKKFG